MPKIMILPGDGVGPEVVAQALNVCEALRARHGLDVELEHGLIGGAAVEAHGVPLPSTTLGKAERADAILLGAVGGPKWDAMAVDKLESCGIYFGTTGGQVYVSADGGDRWTAIVHDLPSVVSVEVH